VFAGVLAGGVWAEDSIPAVYQEYLFQARQLQALSLAVHIPLVCFGIAFPVLVLAAELRYLRTGDPVFRTLARRWSKVMLALFAVGVVTGTILSFELGLLWPGFMARFAPVFGLGFALEGFSFFLEAIFIAIYVYGWDRLGPRVHLLTGIPIVIAGASGALFVIAVNAWMNNPGGFTLRDGEVVDVDPWRALFGNPFLWHEWIHMYFAAFVVAGFLLAGAYALDHLRGRRSRYQQAALTMALTAAAVAAPLQVIVGDWAAREVAQAQPVKLAAMEGLAQTTTGASEHLLGWYNGEEVVFGISIPKLLSLLAYHDPNATVTGLDTVSMADQPPVNVVRLAFQTMVFVGMFLALISIIYLFIRLRLKRMPRSAWFYRAVVACGPLALVALLAGWITTEVGRQPWIVYGIQRTADAVTGAQGIPVGYATLATVYACLGAGTWWLLRRLRRSPMEASMAPGLSEQPPERPGADGAR
jgi:cytochrome d ubiquinol oxidase subunit I